jgi:hypothetical protein
MSMRLKILKRACVLALLVFALAAVEKDAGASARSVVRAFDDCTDNCASNRDACNDNVNWLYEACTQQADLGLSSCEYSAGSSGNSCDDDCWWDAYWSGQDPQSCYSSCQEQYNNEIQSCAMEYNSELGSCSSEKSSAMEGCSDDYTYCVNHCPPS